MEAAAEAGAERSSTPPRRRASAFPRTARPGDETTPVTLADMVGHYKRSSSWPSRWRCGWPAPVRRSSIVNPSAPIGPWDVKPTPTGQMIVDFLRGRMLGSLDTGLNVVHVRDVARGHLLAAERGRVGRALHPRPPESLAPRDLHRPRRSPACPPALPRAVCGRLGRGGRDGGRGARHAPAAARSAHRGPHGAQAHVLQRGQGGASSSGCPRPPPETALADAVDWFVEHGYAPRRREGGVNAGQFVSRSPARAARTSSTRSSACPAGSATRCTPCTPFAASSTTPWTSAGTATSSGASSLAGARRSAASTGAPRRTPPGSGCRWRSARFRSRARRWRRSSPASRWTSTIPATRRSTTLIPTAIGWPPRSASAASRSSATRTRGRACRRQTARRASPHAAPLR